MLRVFSFFFFFLTLKIEVKHFLYIKICTLNHNRLHSESGVRSYTKRWLEDLFLPQGMSFIKASVIQLTLHLFK